MRTVELQERPQQGRARRASCVRKKRKEAVKTLKNNGVPLHDRFAGRGARAMIVSPNAAFATFCEALSSSAEEPIMDTGYRIVLTTTNSTGNVKTIVDAVLAKKLAACIQVLPIESHYLWQEKVNHESEFLLLLKAKASDYADLESAIRAVHAYEIPEIIGLDIENGSSDYLAWISAVTR
jgi:periplasmic divalent cation tolerance protein